MADPTAVTLTTMEALNTAYEYVTTDATASADATAEVFSFTPTRKRGILIVDAVGPAVATAAGNISGSIAAGDLWAGKAITFTATKAKITAIEVDTARVLQDDGSIQVTLTPGAGDKLEDDHLCKVSFVEII
jgi:hypothetical protein